MATLGKVFGFSFGDYKAPRDAKPAPGVKVGPGLAPLREAQLNAEDYQRVAAKRRARATGGRETLGRGLRR